MKTWEKNIRQVLPYIPGEQPKQADIIKLNTNENPYPPSPRVAETLEQFQTGELRLYPDPDSNILVEALADFYQIDRSRIFVGVGSDDVLAVSFLTFFNSGKPVLFPDITYSFYDVWARLFQIPFEQIPLDGEFQIRKSDYFRENGGVVFPNPNAPTGILMGLPEIEDIISHNQDVVVIVDEAYIDFGGISAFPLLDKYDNLLIIQTVSKSRALAGLRVGYAFGSPQLISYLNDVRNSFNSYTMNRLTQTLGAAAVRDREYFERTNDYRNQRAYKAGIEAVRLFLSGFQKQFSVRYAPVCKGRCDLRKPAGRWDLCAPFFQAGAHFRLPPYCGGNGSGNGLSADKAKRDITTTW